MSSVYRRCGRTPLASVREPGQSWSLSAIATRVYSYFAEPEKCLHKWIGSHIEIHLIQRGNSACFWSVSNQERSLIREVPLNTIQAHFHAWFLNADGSRLLNATYRVEDPRWIWSTGLRENRRERSVSLFYSENRPAGYLIRDIADNTSEIRLLDNREPEPDPNSLNQYMLYSRDEGAFHFLRAPPSLDSWENGEYRIELLQLENRMFSKTTRRGTQTIWVEEVSTTLLDSHAAMIATFEGGEVHFAQAPNEMVYQSVYERIIVQIFQQRHSLWYRMVMPGVDPEAARRREFTEAQMENRSLSEVVNFARSPNCMAVIYEDGTLFLREAFRVGQHIWMRDGWEFSLTFMSGRYFWECQNMVENNSREVIRFSQDESVIPSLQYFHESFSRSQLSLALDEERRIRGITMERYEKSLFDRNLFFSDAVFAVTLVGVQQASNYYYGPHAELIVEGIEGGRIKRYFIDASGDALVLTGTGQVQRNSTSISRLQRICRMKSQTWSVNSTLVRDVFDYIQRNQSISFRMFSSGDPSDARNCMSYLKNDIFPRLRITPPLYDASSSLSCICQVSDYTQPFSIPESALNAEPEE